MIPSGIFSQSTTVSTPSFNALFVVLDKNSPTVAEQGITTRLENNHNCVVTYISDEDTEALASGYDFAIIGNIDTATLGTKYRDIILNWMLFKGSSHDELNVNSSNGTTRTPITTLDVTDNTNYLTNHFSSGSNVISTGERMACNAFPANVPSGAVQLANLDETEAGLPNRSLYYIKQGNSLSSGTAPALRLVVPFYEDGLTNLNADGLSLFDKCIDSLKDPSLLA